MEIYDMKKYNAFMKILVASIGIGAFTDLYDTAIVGGSSSSLIPALHLTSAQFGLFAASTFIGGAIGALSFGLISDKIGRKETFLVTLIIFAVGELLISMVQNFPELLTLRLIVGFGIGADYPPAITMLSEYVDKDKRGKMLVLFWIIFGIGGIVSDLVAYALLPLGALQWRLLFITGAIPPIIGIFMRRRIPEAPRWLAGKGRIQDALESLSRVGLKGELSTYVTKSERTKSSAKLFKPYILGIAIPLFLITFLLNVPLSGFAALTPYLLSGLKISSGYSLLFSATAFFGAETLGAVIAYPLSDRIGRIPMLLIGSIVTGVSILLMSLFAHASTAVILISLLTVAGVFSYFYVPVIYSIATELYPTKIRGTAQGLNIFSVRLAGIFGTFGGTYILTVYLLRGLLIIYGSFAIIAFVISILWLGIKAETSRKELETISEKFEEGE
ncbi:MAG: hypothetical protein B2I17_04590 [Thermoplasmatales archaeon B_DKE]|nr:MAG: hypothetical protein B2I17_04590 [Thermoplasmatales archaeon B_DKE]